MKKGSDCWFSDDPQRFLGRKYKANEFEKLTDIVEVGLIVDQHIHLY